jgi:hypothetical protein
MKPRVRDLVDLFADGRLPDTSENEDDGPSCYEHGGAVGRRERTKWLFEPPPETESPTE